MKREYSRLLVPTLGIVLVGIQIAGLAASLSPSIRFMLAIFSFILWPGSIVSRRFLQLQPAGPIMRFIVASIAGMGILSILTWILMMLNAKFTEYYSIMIILVTVIYITDFVCVLTVREAEKSNIRRIEYFHSLRIDRVLAGFALLIALYLLIFGVEINSSGDALDHIGYLRKIESENSLEPHGVLTEVISQDKHPVKGDPRKGTFHPFLALLSKVTQIDPSLFWTYLPVFLAPLAFLSFSIFSLAILPDLYSTAVCIVLFLMFQGGIGGRFLQSCASGLNLSLIFFWIISSLSIFFLRRENNTDIKLILLALIGGSLVHIGVFIISLPTILSLFIFQRFLGLSKRRSFQLLLGAFFVGLPVLLWKFTTTYTSANELHMHPQALLYLDARYFVVSPMEIIRDHSIVFLGGIVLLPGLFFIMKNRSKARFCGSLSFFPVVIAFNPFLAPLLYSRISYMLQRLVLVIPGFQLVVLVLGSAIVFAKKSGNFWNKLAMALLIILWVHIFFVPAIGALSRNIDGLLVKHIRGEIPERFSGVVEATLRVIPDGSVIISDPLTSYALSAYRDVKVVSVLHQHGNPNDIYALDRISATAEILSPFITQRQSMESLRKFGVEYIVMNGDFIEPVTDYMAYWNSGYIPELMNKYSNLNDNFRLICDKPGVRILRVLTYDVKDESWFPTVPFLQKHEGTFKDCNSARSGGIWASKIRVEPSEVIPGEEIKVTVAYNRSHGQVDTTPRKLILRFENKAYISRFGSFPGSKIIRRIAERRRGVLSRYTMAHNLMNGLYPPASWPIGACVFEDFMLKVPSSMLEGNYTVQLKIVKDSLLPNFHVRDFLYNTDSFSGTGCATLQVRKSLLR